MELEDITFKEYYELDYKSEYNFALKYAYYFNQPDDIFEIGDVMELNFGTVKDIQHDMESGIDLKKQIEYVCQIKNITHKDIAAKKLSEISRGCSYLISGIKDIIDIEAEMLSHRPTDEQIQAGLERYNGLGVYLQLRSLAGNDVTKIDSVKKTPYNICFLEMLTRKHDSEFDKDLNEVFKRKHRK